MSYIKIESDLLKSVDLQNLSPIAIAVYIAMKDKAGSAEKFCFTHCDARNYMNIKENDLLLALDQLRHYGFIREVGTNTLRMFRFTDVKGCEFAEDKKDDQQQKENVLRWIPVSEKEPEPYDDILMATAEGLVYNGTRFKDQYIGYGIRKSDIAVQPVAWMPTPKWSGNNEQEKQKNL